MKKLDRMTKQEKQLLIIDLCARLPYGVKIKFDNIIKETVFTISELGYLFDSNRNIIPYLRPVSSMTDKEIADAVKYIYNTDKVIYTSNGDDGLGFYAEVGNGTRIKFNEIEFKLGYYGPKGIDWLNAHHFDYRGLIEKGLALEAPEGMYKNVPTSI